MAVSKRLRYEILRRDNHTCRYCGDGPPDVKLTIDHVTPVALGGTDEPSNLVTACQDCNAGKTSSSPDAPVVEDVAQDALRWSKAMQRAADIQQEQRDRFEEFRDEITMALEVAFLGGEMEVLYEPNRGWHLGDDEDRTYPWVVKLRNVRTDEYEALFLADTEAEAQEWADNVYDFKMPILPRDWGVSASAWMAAGITSADLDEAARITADRGIGRDRQYRYFCGVIWRTIDDRQQVAHDLLAADAEGEDGA